MFHWCNLETEALMAVLSAIPLVGIYFRGLHAKWHAKFKTKCNHEEHDHK